MRELTGKKVFMITAGAFGVIIAVNLAMAYSAISTFPGIEVRNSYVASQGFDEARARQAALGWDAVVEHDAAAGILRLKLTEQATGLPADVRRLDVLVGRATEARDDQRPAFARSAGVWQAPATLTRGKWMIRIEAEAADGTLFRQRRALFVAG
jgi:nitrogen fixation protein FixH